MSLRPRTVVAVPELSRSTMISLPVSMRITEYPSRRSSPPSVNLRRNQSIQAWIDWLRRRFTDGGGGLREGDSVIRIETGKEIIVDLESSGTATTVRGRRLIVSAKWEKLNLLLLGRKPFHRLGRRVRAGFSAAFSLLPPSGGYEGG